MFIKKISSHERSLILASSCIHSYKKAVEELVYNALDAEATSIAIRINIEQNSIQVIDNGCGITKKDLVLTGQRHMTSKCQDKSNLKSNKYGYRGESLANIVKVSKTVKITSRCESSVESWEKYFNNGRKENIIEVVKRPSKGTTVEIKGFLYNLTIQTKSINPLNELQEIKMFFERISLVHNNISLSLRDDCKNEIIFQLHKKRDIYQTFSCLYGINRSEIRELKVEKKQYVATAFIAKEVGDNNNHWIFLNRIFVNNFSKLHKIVNDNLQKCIKNEYFIKKSKIKYDNEDMYLMKNKLPFYFLFIQCPVTDYDVISNRIEFNNWDEITKLLEKLVKFYFNDLNLKTVTNETSRVENNSINENTREQVKKIMCKILASNPKVLGVSQMQNGIKGKITKRKRNQKRKTQIISHGKLTSKDNKQLNSRSNTHIDRSKESNLNSNSLRKYNKRKLNEKLCKENIKKKFANTSQRKRKFKETPKSKNSYLKEDIRNLSKKKSPGYLKNKSSDNTEFMNDSLIRKFINPTDSMTKRCDILERKAQEVINHWNTGRFATHVDKSIQYSCIEEQYKGYLNLNDGIYLHRHKKTNFEMEKKDVKSSYDLLKTILNTQVNNNVDDTNLQSAVAFEKNFTDYHEAYYSTIKEINSGQIMSKLTYESHNYEMVRPKNLKLKQPMNTNIVPEKCKDTFVFPDYTRTPKIYQKYHTYKRNLKEWSHKVFKNTNIFPQKSPVVNGPTQNIEEFSQMFDVPKSIVSDNNSDNIEEINSFFSKFTVSNCDQNNLSLFIQNVCHDKEFVLDKTYNIPNNQTLINEHRVFLQNSLQVYTSSHQNLDLSFLNVEKSNCVLSTETNRASCSREEGIKIDFIPESKNSSKSKSNVSYEPIDVCEAVYLNDDLFEKEFEISFSNIHQNKASNIDTSLNSILCDVDDDNANNNKQNRNEMNSSHHFNKIKTITSTKGSNIEPNNKATSNPVADKQQAIDLVKDNLNIDQLNDIHHNDKCLKINLNSFDLKNRMNFVPKGMSPIFKNCITKHISDFDHNIDYFQDSLYYNFANEVQIQTEIYNEDVQNQNKCKSKTDDDIALKFDGQSLKHAEILNQVDYKFIAAIIKAKSVSNEESTHFLAFFDQHAVHERIRLESNMSEYLVDGQWKSVSVDGITIALSKDEMIYLHNYKDKFGQLGLKWTTPYSNEIIINSIPKAIIGKNPRQVDKIMIAVKNLIREQISNIKSQNGCISTYPKSIMDLVFSEACRYAIMFGDKLTKEYSGELLQDLSKCKNPFQCAHGRPVMAVLTDIMYNKQEYKVNLSKLKHFKQ
ncbi:protein PFF0380w isoform X2 [Manduca sexta]|uniref:protein PFF0380w isoform X2 n=1 Tax=Manduca sexta TaxID=7130 RepID=UPI00188EE100|nr:protein PFF0380w isoform X2 [Manduca sexta]